jgi:hypothetical protein
MSNDLSLARPGTRVRKRNYLLGALVDVLCSRSAKYCEARTPPDPARLSSCGTSKAQRVIV